MTDPDGRVLTYDYGTTDGIDDVAGRVGAIVDDDSTDLTDYSDLDQGSVVIADRPQPKVKFTLGRPERQQRPQHRRHLHRRPPPPRPQHSQLTQPELS